MSWKLWKREEDASDTRSCPAEARNAADELNWSPRPGCFERHLQRKFGNVLFPPPSRVVMQFQIDEAKARDLAEADAFRAEVGQLLESMSRLSSGETTITFSQWARMRERLGGLLDRPNELGGHLEQERSILSMLWDGLIAVGHESLKNHRGLLDRFEEVSSYSKSIRPYRSAFTAQVLREDTPIMPGELVPSLLTEDIDTVRSFVEFISAQLEVPQDSSKDSDLARQVAALTPDEQRALVRLQLEAAQFIEEFKKTNRITPELEDKLHALGVFLEPP
ncbi:MAG TPA: hypothetical protein VMT20_24845 [Terriglobia bacterium]|nr:hypothetical protein [Terriglobia bacterium]